MWRESIIFEIENDALVPEFKSLNCALWYRTMLGPLMFLLHINNISKNLTSHVRLLANNFIMYRPVISTEDSLHLHKDLDRVFEWTQHWQMQLNIQKCVTLWCTRSYFSKTSNYTINGHFLELKHQHSQPWPDN